MNDEQFVNDLLREDELGAVIRSHLYIEHITDKCIDIIVKKPKFLKSLKLDFDGKVQLLVALGVDEEIKKPLSVFGGIRNKFAHRPNYKLDKSEISNLYNALSSDDKQLLHSCYKTLRTMFPQMSSAPDYKSLGEKEQFILLAIAVRGIIMSAYKDLKAKNA